MEYMGRRPDEFLGTIHGPGYSGSSGKTATLVPESSPAKGFHTYTVDWEPGALTWYYDGVQYHHVTREDVAQVAEMVADAEGIAARLATMKAKLR